ncbi:MAG TPA: class I SAM-dependent methyltransferase [Planctomycetota bacterium]|jgi:ubiquinone/menaquinone biosynthesis C-methylase UbiE|nr:class I SAM-dependent methyltransferase [Planctomycetota bacterium]
MDDVMRRMKDDWNKRAKDRPMHFIASGVPETVASFLESGMRDTWGLFSGIEELVNHSKDVLDIGCGVGRMDAVLAPRVRTITGVDVSSEMVRLARENLNACGNATFIECDGASLSVLPSGSFDLVFSYIVFQHVPKFVALAYLSESFRVLRSNGVLVFQVPEANGATICNEPPHEDTFSMRFFAESEVSTALTSIGFSVSRVDRYSVEQAHPPFNHMRFVARKVVGGEIGASLRGSN